jgi:hypothetical protein
MLQLKKKNGKKKKRRKAGDLFWRLARKAVDAWSDSA